MNPRKSKDLIPEVSKETGLDESLLRDLTEFYWKEVHNDCTSLEHLHIRVPHLGAFHIKGDKVLTKEITRLTKYVGQHTTPPKTMHGYARCKQNKDKMDKMKILVETINSESVRRKQIRQTRKDVKAQKNLEREIKNP